MVELFIVGFFRPNRRPVCSRHTRWSDVAAKPTPHLARVIRTCRELTPDLPYGWWPKSHAQDFTRFLFNGLQLSGNSGQLSCKGLLNN